MGDVKYDLNSFCAIAMTLRIGHLFDGGRRRLRLVGGEREEDFFEAHAHRAELEKAPAARHDGSGKIAADVVPAVAFHFVADERVLAVRFRDAHHAWQSGERGA